MILGVHHVQITIPKGAEEEAREFYCGLLGLTEIPKPVELTGRGGFWLAVGDRQVHVGTENNIERDASKAHIAYLVEDLEGWRRKLSGIDISILDGIPIPGYQRFEFRDPFGNRVEFLESVSA
jgi:catechol 2,3-dioxygenase-like lactoylglutathione lyase family enzyme